MSNHKSHVAMDSNVTNLRADVPNRVILDGAQAWWSVVAEGQREMGEFVSSRLAKDGEAIKEALACRNWTDALGIQARWAEETLRDYNAEITKLTGLYSKAASSATRQDRQSS